jgi:excisionase family DNA binding protein
VQSTTPPTTPASDRLLRVDEAAARLGVSRSTLYTLLGPRLKYAKVGRSTRISQRELEDFVQRNTRG